MFEHFYVPGTQKLMTDLYTELQSSNSFTHLIHFCVNQVVRYCSTVDAKMSYRNFTSSWGLLSGSFFFFFYCYISNGCLVNMFSWEYKMEPLLPFNTAIILWYLSNCWKTGKLEEIVESSCRMLNLGFLCAFLLSVNPQIINLVKLESFPKV